MEKDKPNSDKVKFEVGNTVYTKEYGWGEIVNILGNHFEVFFEDFDEVRLISKEDIE